MDGGPAQPVLPKVEDQSTAVRFPQTDEINPGTAYSIISTNPQAFRRIDSLTEQQEFYKDCLLLPNSYFCYSADLSWPTRHNTMAAQSLDSQRPTESKRILACVLCQQRKKKCDRKSPCSFCIKAKVVCIPSTPAPKRKRRKSTKELMERLGRCEQLLKRCTCVQKALIYDSAEQCSESSSTADTNSSPPPEYETVASSNAQPHHKLVH
ncbi:hypothetical protein EDB80DRAFT_782761 [Ilyonectria destructans]|nr:hypothetical protein EDB80DRAFT_821794 [Ilyonectria destructans]KAH6985365.1 hypothetical protein EDB80DRAFT_782761 [Ilyonectria destructans]